MRCSTSHLLLILLSLYLFQACHKQVETGTSIRASGEVVDLVKNKTLPFATLYLYGAKSTFYGIYYSIGPLDSVKTDAQGKFDFTHVAEGNSIDYGLSVDAQGGNFSSAQPYVIDVANPMFKFNFQQQIKNARVPARELNFTRLHLKVDHNPFDTFFVQSAYFSPPILLKGKTLDTVLYLRHLPQAENMLRLYVESRRDTIGLAQANKDVPLGGRFFYSNRTIEELYQADLRDTFPLFKYIPDVLNIPRSTACCK